MRKYMLFFIATLSIAGSLTAQSSKINRLGRWGVGPSQAVYRRGVYTFVGNGAYLEVYRTQDTAYVKLDDFLLPGPVNDIWVIGGLTHVFVACGDNGLQVVGYDHEAELFTEIVGSYITDGYASGVTIGINGNIAYIADGENGLVALHVRDLIDSGPPFAPVYEGRCAIDGYAKEVWVLDVYTALVAGMSGGLYSVNITDPENCSIRDSIVFDKTFPNNPDPEVYHVISIDTVAYVAAGYGGMKILDIRDPNNLTVLGSWVYGGTPVDVRGVWVSDTTAYLMGMERGFFAGISVADPTQPFGPATLPLNTPGTVISGVVQNDTAYVADGWHGHLLVIVQPLFDPRVKKTFVMSDLSRDVVLSGSNAFVALGRSGIRVFNTDFSTPRADSLFMNVTGAYDTEGEALGLAKPEPFSYLYVADGSRGMTILDVANPQAPSLEGRYISAPGDTCFDVDIYGDYALLAMGRSGLHFVDVNPRTFPSEARTPLTTQGSTRALKVSGNRAYVADSSGVYVYDISGLPGTVGTVAQLTAGDLEAYGVDVIGDSVFVANGRYGFLVWNTQTGAVTSVATQGSCMDIFVREKALYVTDSMAGLLVYDFSLPGIFNEAGYYNTGGRPGRLSVSGDLVGVADGRDGFYLFQSEIRPEVSVWPLSLNFGSVEVEKERPLLLWTRNSGTTLLRVVGIESNNPLFNFDETRFNVAPGDTHRIIVRFSPSASDVGPKTGSANIYTNDDTVNISLQGRAVSPPLETQGPYSPDVLTYGLWHFDEAGGVVAEDASGWGLDGQLMGGVSRISSIPDYDFGNALEFDGEDDIVQVPFDTLLNIWNNPFTVELWFAINAKPATPDSFFILLRRGNDYDNTSQYELALGTDEGFMGTVWDRNGVSHTVRYGSMDDINVNQWYHMAMTWDMDSLRLYVNSALRDKRLLRENLRNESTQPLAIGSNTGLNAPLFGKIDEVRFSRLARQAWEFRVNHSQLVVQDTEVDFGNVWTGEKRRLPVIIQNGGSESLHIKNIEISPASSYLTVPFPGSYYMQVGEKDTLEVTFSPETSVSLGTDTYLVIESSDPTFPSYRIPLKGEGVQVLPPGAYVDDPFTLGIWHMDEVTGDSLYDASLNAMHGTWNGDNLSRVNGKFGKGLEFPNEYEYMGIIKPLETPRIAPRWGGLAIEAWFKAYDLTGRRVLVRRGMDNHFQFDLAVEGGRVQGVFYNQTQQPVTLTGRLLEPEQWYHTAMVLENDSMKLYINGTLDTSRVFPGRLAGTEPDSTIDSLWILLGRDQEALQPFKGVLDEIRVSNVGRQAWEFNVNLARLVSASDSVDFGPVQLGRSRTVKFLIRNAGMDTLYIWNIASNNSSFEVSSTGMEVPPRGSGSILITFTPLDTVTHVGALTMSSNDPFNERKEISLVGTGTQEEPGGIYTADPFTSGLYHLDAGTGTVVGDDSPNGFGGILMGGVSWTDFSRFGDYALAFPGSGGWLAFPNDPLETFDASDFTIEFWFAPGQLPNPSFVLLRRGSRDTTNLEIYLDAQDGLGAALWGSQGEPDTLKSGTLEELQLNQWYHAALTWDGEWFRLFLNNEVQDSLFTDQPWTLTQGDTLGIGGTSRPGGYFVGAVDEIRFSEILREPWELNVKPRLISLAPSQLDFGKVLLGQSRTLQFTISNQGDQDLSIYEITGTGDVFTLPDGETGFTVYAWQSRPVRVRYTPDADTTGSVSHSAQLTLSSNDSERPMVYVNLSGNSTESKDINAYTSDPHTVGLYHFDEASGDVLVDSSGMGNNGEMRAGTARQTGFFGKSLLFDGESAFALIPYEDVLTFDPADQSFSVECFFRTDTVSQGLLFMGPPDSANYGLYFNSAGQIQAYGLEGSGPRVSDNAWHHVAFTYNHLQRTGRLYVDGIQVSSGFWDAAGWTGGPHDMVLGARDSLSGFFQGHLDELRISDIAREPWEFQLVNYGIEETLLSTAEAGTALPMRIHVPYNLGALENGVSVFYRNGGGSAFTELPASQQDSVTYQATIPAAAVNLYGLEYYIAVRTSSGTDTLSLTDPVLDPVNNPRAQTVRLNSAIAPRNLAYRRFQMVSVPFRLESADVDDVLSDDLDPYNPYQCRIFWWEPADSVYLNFPDTAHAFRFDPGQAYWIVSALEREYDVGAGFTVTTDSSFRIVLNPGWNMIGTPFNFTLLWDNCSLSSDSVLTLYAWDQQQDPAFDLPRMEPWQGYWLYNADTLAAFLDVPPRQAGVGKTAPIRHGLLTGLQSDEWLWKLSAEGDGYRDPCNYAGIRQGAREQWDRMDRPEPPPVERGVELYFDNSHWKSNSGTYAADIRDPGKEGYVWNFLVESESAEKTLTVQWQLQGTLPEGWKAFLFDLDEGVSVSMTEYLSHKFKTGKETPNHRSFKLVAGTPEFIENNSDDIPLVPVKFHLYHNYPNPFNPETAIRYSLPAKGPVKLVIFNSLGQRVRVLVQKEQKAGYHEVIWDGRDDRGAAVSSGVYIYRLQAASRVASRKMVLIR
jgi:hypothetical protein